MNRKLNRIIATAITGLGLSVTAHSETLLEIYQQALANDHQFKAEQAAYAAGQENRAIGRAALLPRIDGSYSYSRSESTSPSNGDMGGEETTTTSKILNAELRQPLFNLSAWHTYQRGKSLSNLAEAEFGAAKQDLIVRTAEAYFDALNAVDNLETALAEEAALEHQLEQTRQRFEVGLTAITEVHEAQAAYDSAVALRLTSEGNLGIAFEALEVLTGQPHNQIAPIEEEFPVDKPAPEDRHEWVEFAVQNNFILNAASLNAEAARNLSRARTADHLPTLSGSLSYTDSDIDGNVVPVGAGGGNQAFLRGGEETAVGVVLNVPLFAGGGTSATRRQTQQQYQQAQEQFYQTQRDVVQQTRSLHLSVVTSVASVKARAQAITSSRSALEATQAGYDVGTRDLVDVLNAQRALYSAQRDYYDALYTYVINSLRLKAAAGLLNEEDIVDLNQWLDQQNQVSKNSLDRNTRVDF